MVIKNAFVLFEAALAVVLALLIGVHSAPPSLVVTESPTSFSIESPIILIRDGSRGVGVSVIGHSYDSPGIREFVSRVYHFIPGSRIELNGGDLTSIRTKNLYFINRSAGDEISPVAAEFTVAWMVEGRGAGKAMEIESGMFSGKILDTSLTRIPEDLASFDENPSEKEGIDLNLTEIESLLEVGDEGNYTIEMKGEVEYTFIPWSGQRVSSQNRFIFFTAEVIYRNQTREKIRFHYPQNFFTEKVIITHPLQVRAKEVFGWI
jgi:hypothetical protein